MARIKGQLKYGLKLGSEVLKDFEIHDHLTAGQLIEAKEQAEKVVPYNVGGRVTPIVVESHAKLGALLLCQQIASIGYLAGPLDYSLFSDLHEEDLAILNLYAELAGGALTRDELSAKLDELSASASPEVTQRGRDAGPSPDLGDHGAEATEQGHDDDGNSGPAAGAAAATVADERG